MRLFTLITGFIGGFIYGLGLICVLPFKVGASYGLKGFPLGFIGGLLMGAICAVIGPFVLAYEGWKTKKWIWQIVRWPGKW